MSFKYKSFIFLIVALLITIAWPVRAHEMDLIGKVIVVDPGHGGKDPGTLNDQVLEKDINLAISLALEKELSMRGASVILIRDGDYDLSDPNASARKKSDFDHRIAIINQEKVDLFLSIHLNYLSKSKYKGAQVFYQNKNEKSEKLANVIQNHMNEILKSDRSIKRIPSTTYMYSKLKTTGVLIECGFLSNPEESALLQTKEYQEKIASVIAEAIGKYY